MRKNMLYVNCQSVKKDSLQTKVLEYRVSDAEIMLSQYLAAGFQIYDMTAENGLVALASRPEGKYICVFGLSALAAVSVPLASITPHESVLIMGVITDAFNNISSIASFTMAIGAGDYEDKLTVGFGTITALTGNSAQGIQFNSSTITVSDDIFLKDVGFDSCRLTIAKNLDVILTRFYQLSNSYIVNSATTGFYYFSYAAAYSDETRDFIENCHFENFKTYSQLRISGKYFQREYGITNVLFDNDEVAFSNVIPLNPGGIYQSGSYIAPKINYLDLVDRLAASNDAQDEGYAFSAERNGIIYFAYRDKQTSNKLSVIQFDTSSNEWTTVGTKGFSAAAHVFLPPYKGQIVVDSNGLIYVLSYQGGSYYLLYKWNGSTWAEVAGTNLAGTTQASIGITSANNVVVAYVDSVNAGKVSVKYYNGSAWATTQSAASASAAECPTVHCTGTAIVILYTITNGDYREIYLRRGTVASIAAAVLVDDVINFPDDETRQFVSAADSAGTIYLGFYGAVSGSVSGHSWRIQICDTVTKLTNNSSVAAGIVAEVFTSGSSAYWVTSDSILKLIGTVWTLQNKVFHNTAYPSYKTIFNGSFLVLTAYNYAVGSWQIYAITIDAANGFVIKPLSGPDDFAWNNYDLAMTAIDNTAADLTLDADIQTEYINEAGLLGKISKRNYSLNFKVNSDIPDELKFFADDDWLIVRYPEAQTDLTGKKIINLILYESDGTTPATYRNDDNFYIICSDDTVFQWYDGALVKSVYADAIPATTYTIEKCVQIWKPAPNISGIKNTYNVEDSSMSGSIVFDNEDNETVDR